MAVSTARDAVDDAGQTLGQHDRLGERRHLLDYRRRFETRALLLFITLLDTRRRVCRRTPWSYPGKVAMPVIKPRVLDSRYISQLLRTSAYLL